MSPAAISTSHAVILSLTRPAVIAPPGAERAINYSAEAAAATDQMFGQFDGRWAGLAASSSINIHHACAVTRLSSARADHIRRHTTARAYLGMARAMGTTPIIGHYYKNAKIVQL